MKKTFNFEVSQKIVHSSLAEKYAECIGYSVKALTLTSFLREQMKASKNPTADIVEIREYDAIPLDIKIERNRDAIIRTAVNLLALNSRALQKFGTPLVQGIVNKEDASDCLGFILEFVLFLEENYKNTLCGELPWNEDV